MSTHLITGAGSGIGASLAERLARRGDRLVLLARSEDRVDELVRRFPRAQALVADLADPGAVADALAGRLPEAVDSLLHVAGVVELGTVEQLDVARWQETLTVNLVAVAELTRLCLPALRAARGHVVLVNSGSGLVAHPTWAAYAASKHGLRGFADALRGEERERGVRVTSVYPGRTATPMQQKVHAQEGKEYDASAWMDPASVATAVLSALDLPRDAEITDLTVRPTP